MGIAQEIDKIIAARHAKVPQLKQAAERLAQVALAVDKFTAFRETLGDEGADLNGKLSSIVVDKFQKDLSQAQGDMARLIKRFSREHIHLSFVGKAGQGKSLVMQQLSGLDGKIIPSADGSDCTGAKSVITNDDTDEITAVITFYTPTEMVAIVNKYLQDIFAGKEAPIAAVSDIPKLKSRDLQAKLDMKRAEANSKFKHLQNYIDHYEEYAAALGQSLTIPAESIEEYVAQYKSDDLTRRYYKFLGVKGADIHCRFPYADCGKIVLVDTIGLGATSLGVEEGMLCAVREDSDGILYMFRPDALRPRLTSEDYVIIEKIADAVSVDYAKEMLFWVFNRVSSGKGENTRLIGELKREVAEGETRGDLAVCQALEVDCADRVAVEENLLLPVLNQMAARLHAIDSLLTERCQERLNALYAAYGLLCGQVQSALVGTVSQDVRRKFEKPIQGLYGKWTNDLRQLCRKRKNDRDKESEAFTAAFDKCLKNAVQIPPLTEILGQLRQGYNDQHAVYRRLANFMRVYIIDNFLTLDESLDKLVVELKGEIVDIMADDDHGRLGRIVPKESAPDEWLANFLTIAKQDAELTDIHVAVEALLNFKLSVKGYLIYLIRNSLDTIDPLLSEQLPVIEGETEDEQAESIRTWMERYVADVKRQIQLSCRPYLQFPNKALFAAARDFYDRVAFSVKTMEPEEADIADKWRYLYDAHLREVWPEEFKAQTALHAQSETLLAIADTWKALNKRDTFRI